MPGWRLETADIDSPASPRFLPADDDACAQAMVRTHRVASRLGVRSTPSVPAVTGHYQSSLSPLENVEPSSWLIGAFVRGQGTQEFSLGPRAIPRLPVRPALLADRPPHQHCLAVVDQCALARPVLEYVEALRLPCVQRPHEPVYGVVAVRKADLIHAILVNDSRVPA